ncbi:MAG TPA: AraC family transcriptional regulator [Mariniphaga anaerophila]|uniref:AraC family transcriptional regulator n=1 Tax=Mariniphaga anaerophila TaxID=1484053 RepID=A0A831L8X3_9BACT|nr:AraC family transcriptional regulator [Mariniphaga anaerophila]
MILYPNIHHFFFTTKERAVLVQLEFKLGIFPQMAPVLELEKNLLFLYQLLTNSQQVIKISNNDEINRVIQKAVKELNEKKRNYRIITRLYFAELFILISRELDKKLKFTGLKINPKAEALLQHIQNNYYQNIDLEQFALKMGVSSRHLRKLFKLNFGISPVSYLLEFRINKALELLNDPKLNVKEVAFETGFTTPQYFSKKFREITGMSPRKYKKSLFRKI